MRIKYSLKLVLLLTFFAYQCKNAPQKTISEVENKMFSFKTTECMGTCPVFTFTVYTDGSCSYNGVKNVNNVGTFIGALSATQLQSLKEQLLYADFFNLKVENNSLAKDLPTSNLYYNNGVNDRTIIYYNAENKTVDKLIEMANSMITNIEWNEK